MPTALVPVNAIVAVPTATTRVPLSAVPLTVYSLLVSAPADNTGIMYLGGPGVSAANGIEIAAGNVVPVTSEMLRGTSEELQLDQFFVDAATSADEVRIMYLLRG